MGHPGLTLSLTLGLTRGLTLDSAASAASSSAFISAGDLPANVTFDGTPSLTPTVISVPAFTTHARIMIGNSGFGKNGRP